jgi:hypothetical protein
LVPPEDVCSWLLPDLNSLFSSIVVFFPGLTYISIAIFRGSTHESKIPKKGVNTNIFIIVCQEELIRLGTIN